MSSGREKEAADENRIEDVRAALSHKKSHALASPNSTRLLSSFSLWVATKMSGL